MDHILCAGASEMQLGGVDVATAPSVDVATAPSVDVATAPSVDVATAPSVDVATAPNSWQRQELWFIVESFVLAFFIPVSCFYL